MLIEIYFKFVLCYMRIACYALNADSDQEEARTACDAQAGKRIAVGRFLHFFVCREDCLNTCAEKGTAAGLPCVDQRETGGHEDEVGL